MGEFSPSGCSSSILVLGNSTNTIVTPWSGCATGSETLAPSSVAIDRCRFGESAVAMATWLSRPIMFLRRFAGGSYLKPLHPRDGFLAPGVVGGAARGPADGSLSFSSSPRLGL